MTPRAAKRRKAPRDRLPVAFLWHQHQPFYRLGVSGRPQGAYLLPWVRLHAVRDYYSMADIPSNYPDVHVTINMVPSLMVQLEDYAANGATDLWMELCLTPTDRLTEADKAFIVSRFFDANWRNEVQVHPRYAELLRKRRECRSFTDRDIDDLKMWLNLAWFPPEARQGSMALIDGTTVSVRELVDRGRDFTVEDMVGVLEQQLSVIRNVLPLHRKLMDEGHIEVSVSPFYHPILPLVADTDRATIDAEGLSLPRRFSHPEDAEAQLRLAAKLYEQVFDRPPRGLWPSEGSVGEHIVDLVHSAGFRWMATDRGVLERSGGHGYDTDDPEVLLRPYRAGTQGRQVSTFFRHTRLSDDIGFSLQGYSDYDRAAADYLEWMKIGFARKVEDPGERILTIVVDGENAWGSYRNQGRAFLHSLYRRLSDDPELVSVTFSEFIDGNPDRSIRAHPFEEQHEVSPLHCASWIDEVGSAQGNDLNIWIGSPEENAAWELLGTVRDHLTSSGATHRSHPDAFESLYAAEGSDWFWWFGDDFFLPQGVEWTFDLLFREHLKGVYRGLGESPPDFLDRPVVRTHVIWTTAEQVRAIEPGQLLRIISEEPGKLRWSLDRWKTRHVRELEPIGDVMANLSGYATTLGPFDETTWGVEFSFDRDLPGCSYTVLIVEPAADRR